MGDLAFDQYAIPPAETFSDTMRLHYGWSSPVRGPDGEYVGPNYISDDDGVELHLEAMLMFAAAAYDHFGGGQGRLPFTVSLDEVREYINDYDNKIRFQVFGFDDEIAELAYTYLSGEGEDYDTFHQVVEWV
ncbi:MAG: hypothetical protein R3313_05595 [Candidatus Saccharimonadales bacterium]|nr:hypothetical protein [Candidatus Saccharimonadales bacterium]